jgi:hypothetical protein
VTSPTDEETVTAIADPSLSIVKSASPTTYSAVGQVISYSYLVTNTGNVTLYQTFTIDDNVATDESCPATPDSLDPGSSITCTASHTITLADLNAGSVKNIASAIGRTAPAGEGGGSPVTSDPDDETVNAIADTSLSIVKTATPTTYSALGQVISYSYLVTNTGNVTLYQTFTIDDNVATDESCPATPTSLDPGSSITCSASHTITLADLNAGSVTNTASATGKDAAEGGNDVTSPTDEETVTAIADPSLSIVKTASPTTYSAVGRRRTQRWAR